jgi:rare lipoprotein A (peptidoglycan hydrolase)
VTLLLAVVGMLASLGGHPDGGASLRPKPKPKPAARALASWYQDAGATACGFHATYGFASRTLPCGTKIRFTYGRRSVVGTMQDRGPFVYSRLYDLGENLHAALACPDLCHLRWSRP